MSTDIVFKGGHIFNNHHYPEGVMTQSIPLLKQIGKNVNLAYATVDVDGAVKDLATIGYSLRQTSQSETFDTVDSSYIADQIDGLVQAYWDESITIKHGSDVILGMLSDAINNQAEQYKSNLFWSSTTSEGSYFSYQLTFYSLTKASFCVLVMSFIAFKEQSSIFGIPTSFTTGVGYNAQVLEVKMINNNVLYNFGRLLDGDAMGSPDGQHKATFSNGNLSVDSRWETGTAGTGSAPHKLVMQEDANLVIYDNGESPTWASGSQPGRFSSPPYRLEMQDDGNLVIYDSDDSALWAIGLP